MDLFTTIAVYLIFWWIALFLVLPFGAHNQADTGRRVMGTERGAPVKSPMMRKFRLATLLSLVIWGLFVTGFHFGLFDVMRIPFFARLSGTG